jgi:hypothetical protein
MDRTHALLAPSAAYRWLHCTPSVQAEAQVPDKSSPFADEGTVAHALAAKKLRNGLGFPSPDEDAELASDRGRQWLDGEMDECAEFYAQFVMDRYRALLREDTNAKIYIEQTVKVPILDGAVFGTADALLVGNGALEVIDFKYGRGVAVKANDNPQLMLYAAGALAAEECAGVTSVQLVIVQPRKESVSGTAPISADFIRAWLRESVNDRAMLALEGAGYRNPGTWCKFCKVKATCGALAAMSLSTPGDYPLEQLSLDRLGDALRNIDLVEQWVAAAKDKATEALRAGREVPGFKLVEGRRVRRIVDPEGLSKALTRAGYTTDQMYRPQELRTITDLEKMVGRKRFGEISANYIDKPAGAPVLAPESDGRATWRPGTDFDNL